MKKLTAIASLGALSIALAACGSAEDATAEASPDTVEMAAEEALEPVTEEPVADADAASDEVEGPAAVSEETATSAADSAAAVAAEAEEAANAANNALDKVGGLVDKAEEVVDTAKETID